MMEHDTDPTRSTSLDPSKQTGTPQLVVPLNRAFAPHPDFRSEPATLEEESFRHGSWQPRRRIVFEALQRCGKSTGRLDRFAECGSGLWVGVCSESDEVKLQSNCCHDRWCVPCQATRAAILAEQIELALYMKTARFITLTLKHSPTPLSDQLDRLYASFVRLRHRSFWKEHVDGGCAVCELKLGRDGLWHVHLHLLLEGKYLDQRTLSREWHGVTGDSSIVDVRIVRDGAIGARYVSKYATKPACSEVYDDQDKLDEMILALGGRRLVMTFGTWRGLQLHGDEVAPPPLVNKRSLHTLLAQVRRGEPNAYGLWRAALAKWPGLGVFLNHGPGS